MPQKRSAFAPDRHVCAYCRGTGWANQRDTWNDDAQRTVRQFIPGVVPCLCTQGHNRQSAYQKAVEHNSEEMRKCFGNNWREDYKTAMDLELARLNPPVEKIQESLF